MASSWFGRGGWVKVSRFLRSSIADNAKHETTPSLRGTLYATLSYAVGQTVTVHPCSISPASGRKASASRAAQFNSVSKTRRNARGANHLHTDHFPNPSLNWDMRKKIQISDKPGNLEKEECQFPLGRRDDAIDDRGFTLSGLVVLRGGRLGFRRGSISGDNPACVHTGLNGV
jgi:hypothetical protein